MKILLLNQDWFAEEWRAAGHHVEVAGLQPGIPHLISAPFLHIDTIIKSLPVNFSPDCIIFHDNSSPLMFNGFDETDIPTILYSVDTHHHSILHSFLYNVFDATFVAQSDYIPYFTQRGQNPEWLPLWASRYVDASTDKKHGAVFVGNINPDLNPERKTFFDALTQKVPVFLTRGHYWEIFPFSEIVINQTVKGDLNFRVFEAMMCGAMLLTEKSGNGLFELFKDGTHLVSYTKNNVDEAAALINEYLNNPARMREVAAAGREEILKKHLSRHRAEVMFNKVTQLKKTRSPLRYSSMMVNFAILAQRLHQISTSQETMFHVYISALRSIENAIAASEPINEEIAMYAVVIGFSYDVLTKHTSGRELLNKFAEAYPHLQVSAYAKMKILLDSGNVADATALAKKVSDETPEDLFKKIEELIQSLVLVS